MTDQSEIIMKEKSSATKILGKIFAAVCAVLLIAAFAASWYIGGQDKAIEKYCAAVTSGDLKKYTQVMNPDSSASSEESAEFKQKYRDAFTSLPQFSELEDTDIIGSEVKIKEHRYDSQSGNWMCTADIDFFSSGNSITKEDLVFTLDYSGGWKIISLPDDLINLA